MDTQHNYSRLDLPYLSTNAARTRTALYSGPTSAVVTLGGAQWRFSLCASSAAKAWRFRAYGTWGEDDAMLFLDNTIMQDWMTTALGPADYATLPAELIAAATETVLEEALDVLEHVSGLPVTISSVLLEEEEADHTAELIHFTLTRMDAAAQDATGSAVSHAAARFPSTTPDIINGAIYLTDGEYDKQSERTLSIALSAISLGNEPQNEDADGAVATAPNDQRGEQKQFTPSESLHALLKLLHQFGIPLPEGYVSPNLLEPLPLQLSIEVGEVRLPLRDLFAVEPRDILLLDIFHPDTAQDATPDGGPVLLRLQNGPVLRGILSGTSVAVQERIMSTEYTAENGTAPQTGDAASVVSPADLTSIELPVRLEIDTLTLTVEQLTALKEGAVLETASSVDSPVTLRVNGKAIGTGELVDVAGKVGVRVLTIGVQDAADS